MNIKTITLFLFWSSIFLGCESSDTEGLIIEEGKFVKVLTGIHMADATLVVKGFRVNSDSVRVRKYYNDVLIENNVTQKQIHNTFQYYTKNPRDFEKVYEKVSANIVKLEKEHNERNDKDEFQDEREEKPIKKQNNIKKRN